MTALSINKYTQNKINIITTEYQINSNQLIKYIVELQFGDQTQEVDATKILRNVNFVVACNIWLFIHDPVEENEWNMILSLNDEQKDIASAHLSQSKHTYKAIKYKIANNPVTKSICRIPKALTIGVRTGINQTVESATCIVLGSFMVIASNIVMTRCAIADTIAEPTLKSVAKAPLQIPLWACMSLVGGALGGAYVIAAVPIQTVGTAGFYVYNGTNTDDVIDWHGWTSMLPTFRGVIDWINEEYVVQKPLIMFKQEHSKEERKKESSRILSKYPNRIPVICEPQPRTYIPGKSIKKKYLVPYDLTVGQFVYVIRKRLQLAPELAIFCFVNNTLPSTGKLMSQIYKEYKDEDGFLYTTYCGQNCYGSL